MTALVTKEKAERSVGFSDSERRILKEVLCPGANDSQLDLFAKICASKNLDPFGGQIHMVLRNSKNPDGTYSMKPAFQTGIDGFRTIAIRSKDRQYVSSEEASFGPTIKIKIKIWENRVQVDKELEVPEWARVGVAFKMTGDSGIHHQYATVRWSERYFGNSPMYERMPFGMLEKCAEALALRKAFPDNTAGLHVDAEVISMESEPVAELTAAREDLANNLLEMDKAAHVMPTVLGEPPKAKRTKKKADDPVVVKNVDNESVSEKERASRQFSARLEAVVALGGSPMTILGVMPKEYLDKGIPSVLDAASDVLDRWYEKKQKEDAELEADELADIPEIEETTVIAETPIQKRAKELIEQIGKMGYTSERVYKWLQKTTWKEFGQAEIDKMEKQLGLMANSGTAKKAQAKDQAAE